MRSFFGCMFISLLGHGFHCTVIDVIYMSIIRKDVVVFCSILKFSPTTVL